MDTLFPCTTLFRSERTRVDYLDRQGLEAERRREQLASERAALDLSALAEAFAGIEVQHEEQKASLDTLGGELEPRKQAVTELQDQHRTAPQELAEVRNKAQAKGGRPPTMAPLTPHEPDQAHARRVQRRTRTGQETARAQ